MPSADIRSYATFEEFYADWHQHIRSMMEVVAPENVPVFDSVRGLIQNGMRDAWNAALEPHRAADVKGK